MTNRHNYAFAVLNASGNVVKIYVDESHAKRKLERVHNGRIIEFVRTDYKLGVELAYREAFK